MKYKNNFYEILLRKMGLINTVLFYYLAYINCGISRRTNLNFKISTKAQNILFTRRYTKNIALNNQYPLIFYLKKLFANIYNF